MLKTCLTFLTTRINHSYATSEGQKPRLAQTKRESGLDLGGRYWDRTSDPHNVNVVLYR